MPLFSYCVECDAHPAGCECGHPDCVPGCDHSAARYLDPIAYTEVRDEHGGLTGYQVPDPERERWDNAPTVAQATAKTDRTPKPIQKLIVELDDYIYLSDRLETELRAAYERKPAKVERLIEHVIAQTRDGKLDNPGGYLVSQLKEL